MTAQIDLFGEAVATDPRDLKRLARTTYRELGIYDVEAKGCVDCRHGDWKGDRCRLSGRSVYIDFGTCDVLEIKT